MANYKNAIFSNHALSEMARRNIQKHTVNEIVSMPDAIRPVREGRVVLHKTLIAEGTKKALLYRLFIDIDRKPPVIVTVYATSKIAKYESFQ